MFNKSRSKSKQYALNLIILSPNRIIKSFYYLNILGQKK